MWGEAYEALCKLGAQGDPVGSSKVLTVVRLGDFKGFPPEKTSGESAAICVLIRNITRKEAQNLYFGNGCEI